jgi:hypothetical protein
MAARSHLASPDRNGRTLLAAVVLGALVAFLWVVATLASAAF